MRGVAPTAARRVVQLLIWPRRITSASRLPTKALFSTSIFSYSSAPRPLLRLTNAHIHNLSDGNSSLGGQRLDWTIHDKGSSECWAIVAPASERGGAVRRELVDILLGKLRPRKASSSFKHEPVHPFLFSDEAAQEQRKSPSRSIKHVSFATKMGNASQSGEFTNYSARYGAIRDEDRVTLYERLMDLLDCPVGLVARQRLIPDPFATPEEDQTGLFKYKSSEEREAALKKSQEADKIIRKMAPLLLITDELLKTPVIALSNGQTRRARILSSLIAGAELVVLEEPFSGIDPPTRVRLNQLFAQLHGDKMPRLVLVLREQDPIPDLVTHTLKVDDEGKIIQIGPRGGEEKVSAPRSSTESSHNQKTSTGGHEIVISNASKGIGRGDDTLPPLIDMKEVSIVYGEKTVLDRVSLGIHPGDRWILAGDNGSGKTTLLALLLGDHPKSFSFPSSSLSLFGEARDHPSNARTLINRKIGHLSPELFNAFPRRSAHMGGLTVGEVIASGFENIFARRQYNDSQKERVWDLLSLFADLIKTPQGHQMAVSSREEVKSLSARGFTELSHGSQAVVLFLRAVVGNPKLLVLDEPFQGMDKRQVERTGEYLDDAEKWLVGSTKEQRELDHKARMTMAVVVVSHYESEWPTSFGRLLRLKDGKVVERV